MDIALRTALLYLAVIVILRVMGRRTLAQSTPAELVLILIISETIQQAMIGLDPSLIAALISIVTLVVIDHAIVALKLRYPLIDGLLEGCPHVVVHQGEILSPILKRFNLEEEDILEAARRTRGLSSLAQVKFAVIEKDGSISVIPKDPPTTSHLSSSD